jgi:undecaprenyl diphosphate synthase
MQASSEKPHCIGFIMDGNRRWALAQGKERLEGHAAGVETFKNVVRWIRDAGIAHGVFYAFSTENWKRSDTEVATLLALFKEALQEQYQETEAAQKAEGEKGVRIRFIGQRQDFSFELQQLMNDLEEKSASHQETTIWIALSYGGRAELLAAVNTAVSQGKVVDETMFRSLLWSAELPDVDLLIRTSGEQRISNFLPWQLSYSELIFTPTYWPAFTKPEFDRMLEEYAARERRRGA